MPAFDAGLALAVFIATDLDDLLLLAAFFAVSRLSARAIIGGQFTGIAVLVAVSVLAAMLAVEFSPRRIALLGLIPLGMGLAGLWRLRGVDDSGDADEDLTAAQRAEQKLHSQWLAVTVVTIANGGDNLGAYIPLFAKHPDSIGIFALLFGLMTAVWCALGYWLARHPFAGGLLRAYGNLLLPVVLVALGLLVLFA